MSLLVVLLIILLVFGGISGSPWVGWHQWGGYPNGGSFGSLLLIILLVVIFLRL